MLGSLHRVCSLAQRPAQMLAGASGGAKSGDAHGCSPFSDGDGTDADSEGEVVITGVADALQAGAIAVATLTIARLVGVQDVPANFYSCWLVCLPGQDEERVGYSPSFDQEILGVTERQEQAHSWRWATRIRDFYVYAELLLQCNKRGSATKHTRGIAGRLHCHRKCSDAMVQDTAYIIACSRNYDELGLAADGKPSAFDQLRTVTIDVLMQNKSVHRRLRERRERTDRAVARLGACKKISQADWFGSTTDIAAVAMMLQRAVGVGTEFLYDGHKMVSPEQGFVIVGPTPKVTSVISHKAARGTMAARSELVGQNGPMPDTRECVALLHTNDATHFKRLLPVQSGREQGRHWVVDPGSSKEY
jgi:hypothetical protein